MEIKNLNKYFEILINDNYKKSKKSWVISAKNAIDNLLHIIYSKRNISRVCIRAYF